LDFENSKNPFEEQRIRISGWKKYATVDIGEESDVLEKANLLNEEGLKNLDSLHVACAIIAKCNYFLTTDDKVLKRENRTTEVRITDPIGFIKEVLS